jgi:TolB protein
MLSFPSQRHKMSHIHRTVSIFPYFALYILMLLQACGPSPRPEVTYTPTLSDTPTTPLNTSTEFPTQTPYVITATPETILPTSSQPGVFFLSLEEGGSFHLFTYSPPTQPLTRITADTWDDITPAISPDGNHLAYSSRRNGYWDLYLLDLRDGSLLRLTDTPAYDAAPTWSPDGAFIAYESYANGNFDIFIRSAVGQEQNAIQLTENSAADTSPAWSPLGRQIAFISNRSGEPDVWIADLDNGGKFTNISNNPQTIEVHPAWSPDGNKLAWAATDPDSGLSSLYVWDARNPNSPARWAGSGDWPVWQDNTYLASRMSTPNNSFLTGYSDSGTISLPPVLLPGPMNGLSYRVISTLLPGPFQAAAQATFSSPIGSGASPQSDIPSGRASLIDLQNVTATFPQLNEVAGASFHALRTQVGTLTGWDALGKLENAYVPLTTPLDPGLGEDWLYTGRAFTLNPVLAQANWMAIVREDFGQQIYWRIYLRTTAQDGSQGMPLMQIPWDFSARVSNSSAYENGGRVMDSIPGGYWLDLTTLAAQYGWERLPALTNWRTYYAGARYNELAFPQGLDWRNAMLQLYPPEVLVTPTIVIPPTRTPTRTPLWLRSPTPTRTPTAQPSYTP